MSFVSVSFLSYRAMTIGASLRINLPPPYASQSEDFLWLFKSNSLVRQSAINRRSRYSSPPGGGDLLPVCLRALSGWQFKHADPPSAIKPNELSPGVAVYREEYYAPVFSIGGWEYAIDDNTMSAGFRNALIIKDRDLADPLAGRLIFPVSISWLGVAANLIILWFFYLFVINIVLCVRTAVRQKKHCCGRCGYDISGISNGVCPECGGRAPRGMDQQVARRSDRH